MYYKPRQGSRGSKGFLKTLYFKEKTAGKEINYGVRKEVVRVVELTLKLPNRVCVSSAVAGGLAGALLVV